MTKNKLNKKFLIGILSTFTAFNLSACTSLNVDEFDLLFSDTQDTAQSTSESTFEQDQTVSDSQDAVTTDNSSVSFDISSIPEYSGEAFVVVNDNIPFFTQTDFTTTSFEEYEPLDELGRCTVAYANIGVDLMPTEDRESISEVIPSGWNNEEYDFVDGGWVFNRCHLIGFQLTGENANERNLITGTRSMNVDGMLPFENMVADYVKETNNHVLYRITPIFEGDNLMASGVLMEAESVEDQGEGIQYCVYCYNVEPGVEFNYATGENWLAEKQTIAGPESQNNKEETSSQQETVQTQSYVLNTNTKRFHSPACDSVDQMSEKNRQDVKATRDELLAQGYSPCGNCNP